MEFAWVVVVFRSAAPPALCQMDHAPAMTDAAHTFRPLSGAEAGRLREKRIHIVRVRSGDTPERLARRMNFDDYRVERFRVLNGLRRGEPLRAGQRVKLVR